MLAIWLSAFTRIASTMHAALMQVYRHAGDAFTDSGLGLLYERAFPEVM